MCGRFVQTSRKERIAERFGVAPASLNLLLPRYNIAPGQAVLVVRALDLGWPVADPLFWGLLPHWAKTAGDRRYINARSETVFDKPAFRAAARARRCLVPADGYYEWQATRTGKVPHFIHLRERETFGIAGLWEIWERGSDRIQSFTLLTTQANDRTRPIHDRMPVIVRPEHYPLWLDPTVKDQDKLAGLLEPYTSGEMAAYPVSARVNSPKNEGAELVEPALKAE